MLEGPANGTGRAHKLAMRSTPEIHYGSNGVRFYTCFEVPLQGYYPTYGSWRPMGVSARACAALEAFLTKGRAATMTGQDQEMGDEL